MEPQAGMCVIETDGWHGGRPTLKLPSAAKGEPARPVSTLCTLQ